MQNATVTAYLQDAAKYPLLTKSQEIMLARQIQEWLTAENPTSVQARRGRRAQDKLVSCNLRLVISIAKKYARKAKHCELLDLIQEGNIGLTHGVRKFDPERGYALSTYVYWWIRQGITRYLQNQDRIIRLPFNALSVLSKLGTWTAEFRAEHGRSPNHAECAEHAGISQEKLKEYLLHAKGTCSLDIRKAHDNREGSTILDLVADPQHQDPLESLSVSMGGEFMLSMVQNLNDVDRDVVEKYYGLIDGNAKTFTSIGSEHGVSRERIRQRHKQAILKLRLTSAGMRVSSK